MLPHLRYALATVCFAASVGCLTLWGWTTAFKGQEFRATYYARSVTPFAAVACGQLHTGLGSGRVPPPGVGYGASIQWREMGAGPQEFYQNIVRKSGHFSTYYHSVLFPAWFLAILLTSTGIAIATIARFSLRSALIATTVVAGLLGMAVGL